MGKEVQVRTRVPAHGRGELQVGNPGNRGGGRPASQIRERARGSFDRRLRVLEEISAGLAVVPLQERCPKCGHEPTGQAGEAELDVPLREMLKAIDLLGKYGMGQAKELSDELVRAKVIEMILRIRATFPEELANQILSVLRPIWRL